MYEIVWGTRLDPANFRRKVIAGDILRPVLRGPRPIDPPFRRV